MAAVKKPFRILGLADLHDRIEMLDRLKEIGADLIAFCGDLHNAGSRETALPAAFALASLGPPVLIVPGNMDRRDFVPDLWMQAGLRMLHQSSYCCEDLGFLGMGGIVAKDPRRLEDPVRYFHRDDEVYETLAAAYQDVSYARVNRVVVRRPPRGAQEYSLRWRKLRSVSLHRSCRISARPFALRAYPRGAGREFHRLHPDSQCGRAQKGVCINY